MEEDTFRQLEEQFGSSCSCGGSLESANIEVVSRTKNALLARYSCQICGREQMVTLPSGSLKQELGKTPLIEVPKGTITSDDVLDIKTEVGRATLVQIRTLAKKRAPIRAPAPRVTRR